MLAGSDSEDCDNRPDPLLSTQGPLLEGWDGHGWREYMDPQEDGVAAGSSQTLIDLDNSWYV